MPTVGPQWGVFYWTGVDAEFFFFFLGGGGGGGGGGLLIDL